MSLNFTENRRFSRTTGLGGNNSFTYMARILIPAGNVTSTFDILSEYQTSGRYSFRINWNNGQIVAFLQHVTTVFIFFPVYNNITTGVQGTQSDTWYHVAVTLQNRTITMFVDGIQYNSNSHNETTLTPTAATIGANQSGASSYNNYFRGSMKDIRVYNTALDPNVIQTIAVSNEVDQIHGNIISRWPCIGVVGANVTTVSDIAENFINLSPVGGTITYSD